MDVYNPVYPGLYYFDTFTFTTLGTSGHRGPESTKTYANAPWSADQFSIVDGQQQWTVPATGTYRVTAAGAYGATPGRVVSGDVNLNEGQVVSLLVGQMPTPLTANVVDATTVGGGGGTFISTDQQLLMVASGGDGTGGSAASFSPYGDGNGKNGGGYLSNGLVTSATFKFLKPEAYVDGGFGNSFPTGVVPEEGGFGGGQAPVTSGISGGGGYTGSPGDGVSGATCYGAGTITDLGATSNSAGYVTVSLVNPVPVQQNETLNPWVIQPTVFAPATTWSAVAYGNGVYVSVSNNGTYPVMYSTNGIDWLTDTSGSLSDSWISVTFGDGRFSAVSTIGSIAYSYDGINWVVKKSVLYTIVPGAGFDYFGTSIAMSSDGTVIAANIGPSDFNLPRLVKVYTNGVLSYTLTGNPLTAFDGFGASIALSADGTIIAVGATGDNYVKVYTNGGLTYTVTGNAFDQFGRSVALSANGTILAVGAPGADYVNVYTNGVLSYTLTGNASDNFGGVVALSSDGTILAVGAPDGEYVKVYTNGIFSYETFEFSLSNGYGKYLDLNSDGTILAVCTTNAFNNDDMIVRIYNNGDMLYVFTVSTGSPYGPDASVSLNSDGTILAVGVNGVVSIYTNGILVNTLEDNNSALFGSAIALSSDGNILSASNGFDFNLFVKIFDTFFNSVSPLSSVTYGNGKFVAVSNVSYTLYSTDSINWSNANALFDTWSSVTYGNGQFVAVSKYGTTSNVMYSSDGNIWSNVTTGTTSNSWTSVSYGNDRFLAISSTSNVMYSLNGIDWTTGVSTGLNSNCLAFGDGYFVCPSSNSSVSAVSISTNGQVWQELSLNYTPGVYAGITYGDSGFVAVSSTGLLLGFVPTFWINPVQVANSTKLNSVNWSDLAYGNGSFVAVGQGLIQTSLDYGNTWSSFAVSNTFTSVTYSSDLGKFVALPGFFGDGAYTSTDSSTWTLSQTLPSGVPSAPTSLTYGNGQFVAVLYGDSNVFYSRDGLNWSLAQSQIAAQWSSITYGNGRFLAVSNSFSDFETMYSNDGITWTINSALRYTAIGGPSALSSDGTILAAAIEGSIAANVYTNGVLAYTVANISGDGTYLHKVALSADGTILAIGSSLADPNQAGNTRVYINGVLSYTLVGNEYDDFGKSVALSADGTILAVGAPQATAIPGYAKVYTNGVLSYTVTGGITYDLFGSSVALSANGTILAVGAPYENNYTGYVKVYTNGVLSYTLTGNDLFQRFGESVALSSNGAILAVGAPSYDNDAGYVKVYTNGDLSYTLVGNNDNFGRSVDLSADGTILAVSAPNSNGFAGYVKVYTNQILTALFSGTPPESLGNSVDLSSSGNMLAIGYIDFTGPTKMTKIYDLNIYKKRGLSSVTYGNGLFVAVTNPGGSIYSLDGINWSDGNAPVDTWSEVSYGDGFFIAVSDNGTYPVMYSQDGIYWSTTVPGSQFNNWGSVAFGSDTFLAIPVSGATTMTATLSKTFDSVSPPPLPPQLASIVGFTASSPTTTTVNLVWNPVLYASQYSITSSPPTTTQTTSGTTFTFTGLTPLTSYTFTITPSNVSANGPSTTSSSISTLLPPPPAVTGFTVSSPTTTTVNLAWNSALYATEYSIVSSPPTTTQTTSGTTFTFPGLTPLTAYTFTITPSNASGNGPPTTSGSISTLPPPPPAVTGFTASSPTTTTVDLVWNSALNASQYSIVSSPPTTTQTTSGTTFTFTGLSPDTAYTFTITPSNVSGNGPPTTSGSISTLPPPPPAVTGFTASSPTVTTVDLVWNSALNATQYSIVSSPPTTTQTTSGTTFTFTGLSPDTAYTFTITPSNVSGNGPPTTSSSISTLPPPPPPAVTGFTASSPTTTTVNLVWNSALYATQYSIVSSPPTNTQTTSGTSLTFTGLSSDTFYTFTITPSNAAGNGPPTTSSQISTLAVLPPLPPAVTNFAPFLTTATTVDLFWTSAQYATQYSIVSSPPTNTQTTSGTYLNFIGLSSDTLYTFTITPSNAAGNGPSTTSAQTATLSLRPVTTLAGLALSPGSTNGTGSAARFATPEGIGCDTSGNIYVADTFNNTIRKIVVSTGVVTTLAGLAGSQGSADGTGSAARFNGPQGVACDTSGNVYVADTNNSIIRKIVASTGVVTTLAGLALSPGSTNGTGSAARFWQPGDVACDTSGNVFVADTGNSTIRKIVASTGVVTTIAGLPGSPGSTDGTGPSARFDIPLGIVCDTSGNIYVGDTGNSTIRKIVASTGVVTTIAGLAGSTGSTDGTGSAARFNFPNGLARDTSGNIFIADTFNQTIRKIFASTAVVTTLAGLAGSNGSANGTGSTARFWAPGGVACDPAGTVYVADTNNNTIRKIA